jgi:exonuclease III
MSVICWNCRGLGNPCTVRDFFLMVKEKKPNVVFLVETKLRGNKMVLMKYKLGFHNVFVVDCVGKSEGLTLLWGTTEEVEVQNYSKRRINAKISFSSRGTIVGVQGVLWTPGTL